MEKRLSGKCVIITGASEGIGLEAAKRFLMEGAKVTICGRSESKLKSAKQLLLEESGCPEETIRALRCDVGDPFAVRSFFQEAAGTMGGLHILVNNAGFMPFAPLETMEEALWDQVVNVNLKSVFLGIQSAAALMKQSGGVIINAASFAAVMPSVGLGAYAAAKAGVVSLTRAAASELAPYGIRVAGYIPGVIDTALNAENIAKNGDAVLAPISLHRFGTPEDVAKGIVFLASPEAAYITGTCLEISGGKFATQNPAAAWTDTK